MVIVHSNVKSPEGIKGCLPTFSVGKGWFISWSTEFTGVIEHWEGKSSKPIGMNHWLPLVHDHCPIVPVQWPFYGYTVRFRPWCWVLACFSSIIHYDCWRFTPKQNVCSPGCPAPRSFFGNRFRRLFFGNVYSQPPRCPHCFHIWVCLKIGYPNYSHLIGIMIINHWVKRGTQHFQTHPYW